MLLAALWYVYSLAFPQSLPTDDVLRTLPFAVWESLLCVSMCIGLAVVSRDLWNSQNLLGKKMAQGQYATYVFHVGVVLLFQWALLAVVAAPFVKFVLAELAESARPVSARLLGPETASTLGRAFAEQL